MGERLLQRNGELGEGSSSVSPSVIFGVEVVVVSPVGMELPVGFRDVDPPHWSESVTLVAHRLDNGADLVHGHTVRGFLRGPGVIAPWLE